MRTWTRHSQKCLRHPLLPPHQAPVWVMLAREQTKFLHHHPLNARTPVWILLVLKLTRLLKHHLLNARTPALFLLAQGQSQVLNRHLLIALVWTFLCPGSIWQPLWHRQYRRVWASPPTPCGWGTARLAPSALSP